MAEINLLKQTDSSKKFLQMLPKFIAGILGIGLVLVLAYYVWLYISAKTVTKEIVDTKLKIEDNLKRASQIGERNELLTRQQQLQELDKLISAYSYWSQLVPALAKVTLKTVRYTKINVTTGNILSLTAIMPDTNELDKFLQVFNQPEFYKNFYNVKIGNIQKMQEGNNTFIGLEVTMNFNPDLLSQNGN